MSATRHLRATSSSAQRAILAIILASFIILGTTYALVTPAFEASDELWHYPMIRHLADGNPLPVQVYDPAGAGPWKQEASQPPLYYYLGAALTFWIDTSDMETVRWLNPHVDNGVITVDGNTNLAIHDPALNPWSGTLLAIRIVRLASVLLGAATVYLTYRIARLVAPDQPGVYLGAAAVNAFMPMFLFISGAVNNDNLAIPLASLAVLLLIQTVVQRLASPRRWLLIGAVVGLAALTKEGTLGLLPLAWGTAVIASWQAAPAPGSWRNIPGWLLQATVDFLLLVVPVLLIAGWWYVRNLQLYGDLLGWSAFIAVLGERSQPASLAQLWDEREGFLASYWGLFGGVNIPMAGWIYTVLNTLLALSIPGFLLYLIRLARHEGHRRHNTPQPWLVTARDLVVRHFPLVVSLIFSAAVVYGLINWATTTWSSQGRLAFTAVSTLTTLLLLGLVGWLPRRTQAAVAGALSLFLFAVAAAAPFAWIRPAYAVTATVPDSSLRPLDVSFAGAIRLTGYDLTHDEPLHPGDNIDVTLAWEALQPFDRNWSVFVHLNDPVLQAPIAQRDMFLGQGLLPTRLLQPGQAVVDRYRIVVPPTAPAPAEFELVVGLYDYANPSERLPTGQGEQVRLANLALAALPGAIPNPVSFNFGDELELVGYRVEPRRTSPGGTILLSLYWEARRDLPSDYTLFAQVLAEDTTRWAAVDVRTSTADLSTSQWPAGSLQTVEMALVVAPDTPAGVYPLIVGAYETMDAGGWRRLQLVENGRITMDDHLRLAQIRVE
jgi:4-amino-4-deoxy-L-arabinose transferase-like glycosyltransferase